MKKAKALQDFLYGSEKISKGDVLEKNAGGKYHIGAGGWLYWYDEKATFIPFPDEFREDK